MNKFISFLNNLSSNKIFLIIFCFGFIIYGNSISNSFVFDDNSQIKNNKNIHSVWNIPGHFTRGTFDQGKSEQKELVNYYKPVLSSFFSLIYLFSGDSPFGFHIVQILFHIINTFLVFYIFKYFYKPIISLLLALIFLSHPMNSEAVIYISALQDPLFLFFGLSSLYFSLKYQTNLIWCLAIIFLLTLSILSKETGIVFLILLPISCFLFKKREFKWGMIQSFTAFLIYSFLRFVIAKIYFPNFVMIPINTLPLTDRLINIPKIIYFYLSTFLLPKDLISFQTWIVKFIDFQNFYLPLFLDCIFFLGIIIFNFIIFNKAGKHKFKETLFFSIWFIIGLGIHLQIVSLDQTVSDRWFYFPMIGLLGILGYIVSYLINKNNINKSLIVILCSIILFLYFIRIINRNMNWKDNITLATHDLNYNKNSHQLERGLAADYLLIGNFKEAETHFVRATKLFPSPSNYSALGQFYIRTNNFSKASEALEISSKDNTEVSEWILLAAAKYRSGDKEGALEAAKKAYSLSPNTQTSQILNTISTNGEIIFNL